MNSPPDLINFSIKETQKIYNLTHFDAINCLILLYLAHKFIRGDIQYIHKKQILSDLPIIKINTSNGLRKRLLILKKEGYISYGIPDIEAKNIISNYYNKSNCQEVDIFGLQCEWCKSQVATIQEHHYPIRKKDGGENIVKICPNCHYGFHALSDRNEFIRIKDKEFFNKIITSQD